MNYWSGSIMQQYKVQLCDVLTLCRSWKSLCFTLMDVQDRVV